jgi:diacylglycerol kinase family enzyme
MQSHKDFIMHLIDDQSNDGGVDICREATQGDERFRIISNEKKKHKLKNMDDLICGKDIDDEDLIIELDGDDVFSHQGSLI